MGFLVVCLFFKLDFESNNPIPIFINFIRASILVPDLSHYLNLNLKNSGWTLKFK